MSNTVSVTGNCIEGLLEVLNYVRICVYVAMYVCDHCIAASESLNYLQK